MITLRQYQILNACTDYPHLFYAPFAEVNYGGQVFEGSRDAGAEKGRVVEYFRQLGWDQDM